MYVFQLHFIILTSEISFDSMGFVLIKVGRHSSNDFQLDRDDVAAQHLEIFVDIEGNTYLTDLKTESGTFVNGERISDTVLLQDNDEVRIANTIKFNWKNAINKAMENSFSIGSDERNDIQIKEVDVEKFHLQLYKDFKQNIFVKDLDTVNGTFVNGHRVHEAIILKDDDKLRLGKNEYDWRRLFIDRTFPLIPKQEKTPIINQTDKAPKSEKVEMPTSESQSEVDGQEQPKKKTKSKVWKIILIILIIDFLLVLWLGKLF